MLTIPTIVARGVAAGFLDAAQVLDGTVAVYPQSRSNVVYRIERAGMPLAFVKQRGAPSLLDGDDAVANERAVLASLRGLAAVPLVIAVEDPAAVWLTAIPGSPLAAIPAGGAAFRAACTGLAEVLVELHLWAGLPAAAPQLSAPKFSAPRPWALNPGHLPPSMAGSPAGSAGAAVLEAAREPKVLAAVEHASEQWKETAWIHGDVSANNVIVGGGRAALVDLEGGGWGDPDWDLATAATMLRGLGDSGEDFLSAYWQRGGPARLDDAMLTVRSIQTAWQLAVLAEQRGGGDGENLKHLDAARAHAASFLATQGG